jgi:hypothetical protein
VTIVRVGTTKKYSEGWSGAFGKGKKTAEPAPAAKKPAAKKAATKSAAAKVSAKSKSAPQPAKKKKKK